MNQNCSKTQKCSYFWTRIVVKSKNVVSFQPEVYQQFVDTLLVEKNTTFLVKNFTTVLVEKLLHFWVLLRFWFNSYYVSGFYYNSDSKVTTFLVLLHVWLFTTFLGLTDATVSNVSVSSSSNRVFFKLRCYTASLKQTETWLTAEILRFHVKYATHFYCTIMFSRECKEVNRRS